MGTLNFNKVRKAESQRKSRAISMNKNNGALKDTDGWSATEMRMSTAELILAASVHARWFCLFNAYRMHA